MGRVVGACSSLCCARSCYATLQRWCWGRGHARQWALFRCVACAARVHEDCESHLGSVAVAWAVPGGFMKVGLGLLHVVGGINVASRWGCVQGVCEQCRWSMPDAQCADTWAHPAPPRFAAPRHATLTPFPRRMCLQAGGKLPCTAQTCLAFESKNASMQQLKRTLAACLYHAMVTLSLSESGPGRFGGQVSVMDICHTMP